MAHISAPTTVVTMFGVVAAYLTSQYPLLISLPPPQLLLCLVLWQPTWHQS